MADIKMVTMQRANVILKVPEYDVARYYDQGYDIIDQKGNIVKASVPKSLGALQAAYIEHQERIAELEAEVDKLKKQLSAKASKNTQKSIK